MHFSKARTANGKGTPSTSNNTVPALTMATQKETLPFPFPIRVAIGFCVTGTWGKTGIQIFPFRNKFLFKY